MDKQCTLSISVDRELSNIVRREAFINDVTISQYVRDILNYFIENKDYIDFYKKNKLEPIYRPQLSLFETIKGLFKGEIVLLRKRRDIF